MPSSDNNDTSQDEKNNCLVFYELLKQVVNSQQLNLTLEVMSMWSPAALEQQPYERKFNDSYSEEFASYKLESKLKI